MSLKKRFPFVKYQFFFSRVSILTEASNLPGLTRSDLFCLFCNSNPL